MNSATARLLFFGACLVSVIGCGSHGSSAIPSTACVDPVSCAAAAATPSTEPGSAATPAPVVSLAPSLAPTTIPMKVTFYGYASISADTITYPKDLGYPTPHNVAVNGAGAYTTPVTAAADAKEFPPGTRFYVPALQKYLVMESDCATCDQLWSASAQPSISIWIGGSAQTSASVLLQCENTLAAQLGTGSVEVMVNPINHAYTAQSTQLFDGQTNTCS